MRILCPVLALVLVSALAFAQKTQDSWDNLRALRVGEKIHVVDQELKSFTGTFGGVTEEAISIQVGQDSVKVGREDVLRVTARGRIQRRRNALIGLGIGAAVGAAGMVIALEKTTNGPVYYDGEAGAQVIAGAVWGGGLGAAVGAVLPSHPTIYRAPKRQASGASTR